MFFAAVSLRSKPYGTVCLRCDGHHGQQEQVLSTANSAQDAGWARASTATTNTLRVYTDSEEKYRYGFREDRERVIIAIKSVAKEAVESGLHEDFSGAKNLCILQDKIIFMYSIYLYPGILHSLTRITLHLLSVNILHCFKAILVHQFF